LNSKRLKGILAGYIALGLPGEAGRGTRFPAWGVRLSEDDSFVDLIERLRGGDNEAARLLLERYGPVLRRIIGARLADGRLRRSVDADDICQSVFGSFFVRLALGQYELAGEEDLLKLLATMVRNKVASKQRRQVLEKRAELDVPLEERMAETNVGTGESPSERLVHEELIRAAERLLAPQERELIALRKQGLEWAEVGVRLGDSPGRLRKRLARAVDLVVEKLGLDEGSRGRK
jgi:RNA polymerase sigma factor (sigma-70 family)